MENMLQLCPDDQPPYSLVGMLLTELLLGLQQMAVVMIVYVDTMEPLVATLYFLEDMYLKPQIQHIKVIAKNSGGT